MNSSRPRVGITIPVYNKLEYTQLCLQSLLPTLPPGTPVVVVDNASSDGTAAWLGEQAGIRAIINRENCGCATAWNQGVAALDSDWLVILNNDVVLPAGWLAGLLAAAERWQLDVVSPAIREGELNYDLETYAAEFVVAMGERQRPGVAHGVCFMVHRRVFERIGGFDENFRIGQFEDTDFFRRCRLAGFRLATVGSSFLHHFGSVTQAAVQGERRQVPAYVVENRAYYIRKWRLSWWQRWLIRRRGKLQEFLWRTAEFRRGHTLKECWQDGRVRYY